MEGPLNSPAEAPTVPLPHHSAHLLHFRGRPHHLPSVQTSPESFHTPPGSEILEIPPYHYFCIYLLSSVQKAPPTVLAFTTPHMDSGFSSLNQSPYFLSVSLSKNTLHMSTRVLPSKSDFTSLLKIDSPHLL